MTFISRARVVSAQMPHFRCPDGVNDPATRERRCARAARLVGITPDGSVSVSDAACRSCLESTGGVEVGRITPVVASLAYSAARQRLGGRTRLAPSRKVELWEVQQFAARHMDAMPVATTSLAPTDENTSTSAQASGKTARSLQSADSHGTPPAHLTVDRLKAGGPRRQPTADAGIDTLRVGLIGRNSHQGLGTLNRSLFERCDISRWLIPDYDAAVPTPRPANPQAGVSYLPTHADAKDLRAWMDGLDCLLFIETPLFPHAFSAARTAGVRCVCVPNWEWVHPGLDWIGEVDTMIGPTRSTHAMLTRWKQQFGFRWRVEHVDWPIDIEQFPFRLRTRCRTFLFVSGFGGVSVESRRGQVKRKGADLIADAARLAPDLQFLVYSQTNDIQPFPGNVRLTSRPVNQATLYQRGDVCVQPSRWEGLGLPLLECQASGMPLVTTDAAPMNEHNPIRRIPVTASETVRVGGSRLIAMPLIRPSDLVETLRSLRDQDIAAQSAAARRFVHEHHNWSTAVERLTQILNRACGR